MSTISPGVTFGRRRRIPLTKVQAGMMVTEPIIGRRGNVLVHSGEVLSQKHVDFILELCGKKGEACLLVYQREVEIKSCLASGSERPNVDFDPYQSIAVQQWYRRGQKVEGPKYRDPGKHSAALLYVPGQGFVPNRI